MNNWQYITISDISPLPEPFHRALISRLRIYYFTGGMPETVGHYAETNDLLEVRKIQGEILAAYALDFAKHASAPDIPKLGRIWDNIPNQLAQDMDLYYWQSGGRAEVDFICESGSKILPLVVRAGVNPKSKSLRFFDLKYHPSILARTTLLNLKKDDRVINIPLYAIAGFPRICLG